MKKNFTLGKLVVIIFILFLVIIPFYNLLAQDSQQGKWKPGDLTQITNRLEQTGGEQGMGLDTKRLGKDNALYTIIGQWIYWVTSFVGVVFTLFLIYGGWLWFSAQGNEEKITEAKKIIINSVIALAIILIAWTLTVIVFIYLGGASKVGPWTLP